MRYLGVDYGTKRIGLALSDESGSMGFPHNIVANDTRALDTVCKLIRDESVGAVVIGESRNFSGEENPIAKDARAFAEEIIRVTGVPVHFESEVFTSAAARRSPHKEEKTRSPKSKAPVDASAAALILTSYLTRQLGTRR